MFCKDWTKNRIVKRIYELRKNYGFRHMYAGSSISMFDEIKIENLWQCDCCGTLTQSIQSIYHIIDKNTSTKGLCSTCVDLWRVVPYEGTSKLENNKNAKSN